MTHDPLCPWSDSLAGRECGRVTFHLTACDLIARVREDERAAALRDAVEAVKALPVWRPMPEVQAVVDADGVIDAIRALGGERWTHNPLCPMDWDPTPFDCGHCLLIARVREDMAAKYLIADREHYVAALRDAVEAVKLSCSADIELVERTQVIAAIEALGG